MFSSEYWSRTREIQIDKLSERKQDEEKQNYTVNKSEEQNQSTNNNNNFTPHFILKPNDSIPKTVYYKRLCQKMALQNESIKFKNEMPQNNKESYEVKQNKNDKNISKQMLSPIDSDENFNCTLVICESDVAPSDSELDITPINQLEKCKETTENISPKTCNSVIKQPLKKNKKMVITPATIGVHNMSYKSLKSVENYNRNRNLNANIQLSMNKSLENKVLSSLSKGTRIIPNTEHNTQCDSKTDKQLPITDTIHRQKSFSSGDITVIPSVHVENEHTSVKRKSVLIEKDSNTFALIQKNKPKNIICLNPSVDNTISRSTKNANCLIVNNEEQLDSSFKDKLNQLKSELPVINCNNNPQKCVQSNHLVKNYRTNNSVESSPANKTCALPINSKIDQVQLAQKKVTIEEDEKNSQELTKMKKLSRVTSRSSSIVNSIDMSTKNVKCSSLNNEKKTLFKQKNNVSESELPIINCNSNLSEFAQLNRSVKSSSNNKSLETSLADKTCIPSRSNEVDQFPRTRRRVVALNNYNITKDLNKVNKSPIGSIENSSVNLNSLSMINQTKSLSTFKQKYNKSESELPLINHNSNLSELSKSSHINKSSSKNKSVETSLVHKTCMPSTSIEVDQVPIRRKRVVKLMNYNDTQKLTKVNESPISSIENSTLNVKDVMVTNENKSSSLISEQKNQLEGKLSDNIKLDGNLSKHLQSNDSVQSSSESTIVKTGENPTINIEVEQGSVFRRSNGKRKVIQHSPEDNKQEIKQGRRVQLITIQDHYSEPLVSFNGARKTEIDLSKKSIHIEKVVESSSLFYVPQVKKRRSMNFGNADL